jgi:hypothetical protein
MILGPPAQRFRWQPSLPAQSVRAPPSPTQPALFTPNLLHTATSALTHHFPSLPTAPLPSTPPARSMLPTYNSSFPILHTRIKVLHQCAVPATSPPRAGTIWHCGCWVASITESGLRIAADALQEVSRCCHELATARGATSPAVRPLCISTVYIAPLWLLASYFPLCDQI